LICCAALIDCVQVDEEPAAKVWADAERIHEIGGGPRVAIDTDGDTMVVWKQRRTDIPWVWQVWTTRHDGTWDTPAQISEPAVLGNIRGHEFTVHPDGDAVVVWGHFDGTRYDIWSNRFGPAEGWGSPERIENDDRGDASGPQVAMDLDGNVVAVWHQSDGTRFGIWSTRYSPGRGWDNPERIAAESTREATDAQVAMNPSGDAVAVWRESDGMRDDVWSNRYAPGGGWDNNPERIGSDSGGGALAPQVAMDANGNALAVWPQSDGARYSIWSNRYSPAGGWAVAQTIETDDEGDALNPRVAMDSSGSAIAVWEQFDGSTSNIWSNRYDAGWGVAELTETDDAGAATNPQIAVGPDGSAVSVWQQSGGGEGSFWSNRFTESRGWGTAQRIDAPCPRELAAGPEVAMDLAGNAVAVWSLGIAWGDPCHGIWTNRME